jgi:hypothetical protein
MSLVAHQGFMTPLQGRVKQQRSIWITLIPGKGLWPFWGKEIGSASYSLKQKPVNCFSSISENIGIHRNPLITHEHAVGVDFVAKGERIPHLTSHIPRASPV